MYGKKKKFICIALCFTLIFNVFSTIPTYANSRSILQQMVETSPLGKNEEIIKIEEMYNQKVYKDSEVLKSPKVAVGFAPLLPVAVEGFAKLFTVFCGVLVANNFVTSGYLDNVYAFIERLHTIASDTTSELYQKVEGLVNNLPMVTKAFLVMYASASKTESKYQEYKAKLLEIFKESFIKEVESDIGGSPGGDGDKKISWSKLIKYGVTALFTIPIFNKLFNSMTKFDGFGILLGSGTPSYDSYTPRRVCYPNESDPLRKHYKYFTISVSPDPNMAMVDKVYIYKRNITSYNYGWDGLNWTQVYEFSVPLSQNSFQFRVSVNKSLSPNQKKDAYNDGVGLGFYEISPEGEIVKDSKFNAYALNTDNRIDASLIRNIGIDLRRVADKNTMPDFEYLRELMKTALGFDFFPNVPVKDWALTAPAVTHQGISVTDYSKNVPGIYNNEWERIGDAPILPENELDGEIKVPSSITPNPTKPGTDY